MAQRIVVDSSIRPQDDYYHHINNHWLKTNPRPSSYSSWGHFVKRSQQVDRQIQAILRDWSEGAAKLSPAQSASNRLLLVTKPYSKKTSSAKPAWTHLKLC